MDSLEATTTEPETPTTDNPELGPETGTEGQAPNPDEPTYTVKVQGEEIAVPLSELVNGYSRQSDYTRKTQELAAERERLQQAERLMRAFDQDPERTLQALQEAYGVQPTTTDDGDPEELDPEELRWRQVETFMQTQQEREVQHYIDSQFQALQTKYGADNVDRDEIAEFMVRNEVRDFEVAYDALSARKQRTGRAASDQQAVAAKAALPQVAGGHGVQNGVVMAGNPAAPDSLRDAFAAAKQQLGM